LIFWFAIGSDCTVISCSALWSLPLHLSFILSYFSFSYFYLLVYILIFGFAIGSDCTVISCSTLWNLSLSADDNILGFKLSWRRFCLRWDIHVPLSLAPPIWPADFDWADLVGIFGSNHFWINP
jgi:hypothetical protein